MVDVTLAAKADALEFYQLEAKCFDMEVNDKDTLYYWAPILEYQCCFKAVDNRIVGGLVSMPTFDGRWFLSSLFVDPTYRRQGIATRLMDAMLGVVWCGEIMTDIKTDKPHLEKFYGRFGFERVGVSADHYLDGDDRILMVRGHP